MTQIQVKIIDKIRKLMALSESSNQHEAANAAAMAAELMVKHQISEAAIEVEEGAEEANIGDFVVETSGKITTWRAYLLNDVANSAGCSMYSSATNPVRKGSRIRRDQNMRVIGRESDVNTVKYLYLFFASEIQRLADSCWELAKSEFFAPTSARRWKNSFRVGCAVAIGKRLVSAREEAKASANSCTALAVLDKHEAAATALVTDITGGRTRTVNAPTSNDGYISGVEAGKNVNIVASGRALEAPKTQLGG